MDPVELGFAVPRPSGNVPEVEEAVRQAIAQGGGRVSYARFLEICLYHPSRGYYAAFGPETDEEARRPASDYFTSPDLHPAFGHLLAREVALHLDRLHGASGGRLWVVEVGAGRGLLARDILQALAAEHPHLLARLGYLIVEPNPGWLAVQRRNLLPEFAGQVRWVKAGGPSLPVANLRGVVLSNELFDALPFHVLEGGRGGEPQEVFVAAPLGAEGPLAEAAGPLSDPRLARRLSEEGIALSPGQRAEVGLEAEALGADMARALKQGALIAVDYGDEAGALYDARRRPQGTLRCFFRHRLNDEPLERLGRQDITAHVDFTALAGALTSAGLSVHRLERQGEFLDRLGLAALVRKLDADQPRLSREVYVRHRRALEALRDPRGLGGNLVLVARR